MNNESLRVLIENNGLNSSLIEYCLSTCIKQDGNKLQEAEKNCIKTCQTNYQILDNIYLRTASFEKLATDNMKM